MIEHISLLRNIGAFDSVTPPTNLAFTPFSLVYAENSRGKTTLAAILRSLATGDANHILHRHRLGAKHPPHIVVKHDGTTNVFQNGSWSYPSPHIAVFDDEFVANNVCSGIEVSASHRQKLHELIVGAQGVTLNAALQAQIDKVEAHNAALKLKAAVIPVTVRGDLTVDAFCALKADPNIDGKIREAERRLAAAKSSDAIRQKDLFDQITLPDFDIAVIDQILGMTLTNLEAQAAARVREHLQRLGRSGENWVAEGMGLIGPASDGRGEVCPFCVQGLQNSPIIAHYQGYFSGEYEALKRAIRETGLAVRDAHSGDVPTAFERGIRTAAQNCEFWKEFADVPEITVDTAAISRVWTAARDAVLAHLRAKAVSPLEPISLGQEALDAVRAYRKRRAEIDALSTRLQACNPALQIVRERAGADEIPALTSDLSAFNARRQRFDPVIAALCQDYLTEKATKKVTEASRSKAREDLDRYRQTIFPAYETSINDYLRRFNAGFRIAQFSSVNNRAGSSASYCVVINQQHVDISAGQGPSFRNTLSAGDRNTLALAFFFASLDQDANLAQKVVIIDDPMTSLDENRSLTTKQELRRLYSRVAQVVVLSHSKPFLCSLWEDADTNTRSAFRIGRAAVGSELFEWDVRNDSITEHDKRHELVSRYLRASDPTVERSVAAALRPVLEAFMRVACPPHFPPGSLLGPFIGKCQQHHGTGNEILSVADTVELRALLDYANRFHHDTNPAWETAAINDAELVDFAKRALLFASRG
ncbi:AAA family ATPase [Mesorhizobium australicum]|uniref:AAA family ATPase n=1 Tax=Mesorhizobium australicum TaxID=536018 RepID=UPI00333866BA